MKSGTTFLFYSLAKHPSVAKATHKELHYLDRELGADVTATGYLSKWKSKALNQAKSNPAMKGKAISEMLAGRVLLEASPSYIMVPCSACRLHHWAPHAKIILMIRQPTARAVSQYINCKMNKRANCLGGLNATLTQFLHTELTDLPALSCINQAMGITADQRRQLRSSRQLPAAHIWHQCFQGCHFPHHTIGVRCPGLQQDLPVSRGLYLQQLRWLLALFPKEQLLVINYHKMMDDPQTELRRALDFLTGGSALAEDEKEDAAEPAAAAAAAAAAGAPVETVDMKKHVASSDLLKESREVLVKVEGLFARHNAGLRELLVGMGQAHALYNSSVVFPDPWADLHLDGS